MTTGTNGKITTIFLHPRDSREFKAELGQGTTGQQAIDGLVKNNFIEAPGGTRAYALQLQRTGATIPLSSTLVAAGVQDGDHIPVTETSAGA
jgi:hypothetical protein